jgi:hypothetical protein
MPGPVRTAVTRFSPCKMANTLGNWKQLIAHDVTLFKFFRRHTNIDIMYTIRCINLNFDHVMDTLHFI